VYTQVVNKANLPDDLTSENSQYIGRPSKWGNPFIEGKDGNRVEVVAKHGVWIRQQPELMNALNELHGKKYLVCWCKPKACHGDNLVELVNG
jgi:hypothetical protein